MIFHSPLINPLTGAMEALPVTSSRRVAELMVSGKVGCTSREQLNCRCSKESADVSDAAKKVLTSAMQQRKC
jgi:hypothetical protein